MKKRRKSGAGSFGDEYNGHMACGCGCKLDFYCIYIGVVATSPIGRRSEWRLLIFESYHVANPEHRRYANRSLQRKLKIELDFLSVQINLLYHSSNG